MINEHEIIETMQMFNSQHLDIRTITMGISLMDCAAPTVEESCNRITLLLLKLSIRLQGPAGLTSSAVFPRSSRRVTQIPIRFL